jgi:uncharacterized Zn finger protein
MSDSEQKNAPSCPRCGGPLDLKRVMRDSVVEYFFRCIECAVEYTNERISGKSA